MEKITCPNCSFKFDIEGVIAQDIKTQLDKELQAEKLKIQEEKKRNQLLLIKEREEFEEKKKRENEIFSERLRKAKMEQETELKNKISEDFQFKLKSQIDELNESKSKIKKLQEKELQYLKLQREVDEKLRSKEIELQKKIIEEKDRLSQELRKSIGQELELKLLEKDKKLEDQHKLIEELKRKSEQGSMQLQGEIQELAIEAYLKNEFPFDQIEEIKKGATGADTVQTVINTYQEICGKIVYESKRTKAFSNEWINKLKKDQRHVQAEIAVLVTQVMPKDMSRFGQKDGVWICNYEEFKSLSFVLRSLLLKTAAVKSSQKNKGNKMEVLYSFLTSEEFKLQISGIVDGFQNMRAELEREKNSMRAIWKRREKQLEMVISNTIDMYGSIKGIAGSAVPNIPSLELDEGMDLSELA